MRHNVTPDGARSIRTSNIRVSSLGCSDNATNCATTAHGASNARLLLDLMPRGSSSGGEEVTYCSLALEAGRPAGRRDTFSRIVPSPVARHYFFVILFWSRFGRETPKSNPESKSPLLISHTRRAQRDRLSLSALYSTSTILVPRRRAPPSPTNLSANSAVLNWRAIAFRRSREDLPARSSPTAPPSTRQQARHSGLVGCVFL